MQADSDTKNNLKKKFKLPASIIDQIPTRIHGKTQGSKSSLLY